ncbi:TIGR04219 family outer membrane beta-barrel protein [Acinetobacter larvae]|uniref:DUF2490 domain-containing protein n=1 Tax=Acinetobacter larvae TaxID=1789224 RepID=A0A1B2LVY5_9GAMM|nr:TIGR04219 family outer membrane beta-barrel protein [Acinetobacter larvae]AOA56923.1 hypothetical protein BFG52_00150 [Acinetobacter larvae]
MMMRFYLLLSPLWLGLSSNLYASSINLQGQAQYWQYHTTTQAQILSPLSLSYPHEAALQWSIDLQHQLPFLPQAKVKSTSLSNQLNHPPLKQDFSFDYYNYILYYPIFDRLLRFNLGAGISQIDAEANAQFFDHHIAQTQQQHKPIAYSKISAQIPNSGLSLHTEIIYSQYKTLKLNDIQAEVQYQFQKLGWLEAGLNFGYRWLNINYDHPQIQDLKLRFQGPYLGINGAF